MIAAAPIVLEATAEVSDGAGELPDGDAEDSPPGCPCLTRRLLRIPFSAGIAF
jgi:hypothetical protein